MDDGKLPSEYDVIILGTGMTECILAAAFARVGHKVLHLDRNDYYSGNWATFNFKALQEWITGSSEKLKALESLDVSSILKEGEKLLNLNVESDSVTNVVQQYYIRKSTEEETPPPACPAEVASTKSDDIQSTSESDSKKVSEDAPGPPAEARSATESDAEKASDDVSVTSDAESVTNNQSSVVSAEETSSTTAESKTSPNKPAQWSTEKIEKLWRKFNIDLMPKILYSRGPLVELLISSDIAKYCEFRSITRILTQIKGALQQVPCSRSDVFSSKQVNMIEKRMLMKLLTFCVDFENNPEEYQGYEDKTFLEFLKSKNLTPNVLHYVKSSIAMATDSTGTLEGLKNTQKFLRSLGRYGNTAFLWPMYGSGEIPQCFCRMCAVFGGVYCLRRSGQSVIINTDNVAEGIIDTEGQRLSAKWLIMEASYATQDIIPKQKPLKRISRAILLTDKTIFPDSNQHITLMSLPPAKGGRSPITLYELSPLSMACPDDLYVIQLICESCTDNAKSDLTDAITNLFDWDPSAPDISDDESLPPNSGDTESKVNEKPKVLWSLFFNVSDTSQTFISGEEDGGSLPKNLYIVGGPSADLDMDLAIQQARTLFDKLCPGEEFIPKAPNPEDIIFDGEEGTQEEAGGFREGEESKGEESKEEEAKGEESKGKEPEGEESKEDQAKGEEPKWEETNGEESKEEESKGVDSKQDEE